MKPPSEWKIPEWCEGLPDLTRLNAADIAKIFGSSKESIVSNGVIRGQLRSIPDPDGRGHLTSMSISANAGSKTHKTKYYWRLGTIRKWIRDHQ